MIEMFQMPLREIGIRFTTSELAILAWRSQESSSQMDQAMNKVSEESKNDNTYEDVQQTVRKKKQESNANIPQGIPDHFYNEDGEVDLSKVTGREALRYFAAQGIKLPIIPRG